MERESLVGLVAPDFPAGLSWINSEPISIKNTPTLVDFWTYSCVNCIRTLPHLKRWYEEYSSKGLRIIGVHAPEFEFEKDHENVARAVKGFGIEYPVVLDSEYKIWDLYSNHWWPRKLIIGRDGKILHDHIGEGGYVETEQKIREALGLDTAQFSAPKESGGGVCYPQTPELYLGYQRGFIGNPKGFLRDASVDYQETPPYAPDTIYIHGVWKVTPEYIEHTRTANSGEDYLLLRLKGVEVNIVGERLDGGGNITISVDDEPMPKDIAGSDIVFDGPRAITTVHFPRMLNIIKRKSGDPLLLKIAPKDAGIRLYAFTFGGCIE